MSQADMPQPPAGYKWKIRRWENMDYEVLPYPRAGKLAVVLVSDSYYDFWEKHKARALMSPRSIQAAANRIIARHRRAEAREERRAHREKSPGSIRRQRRWEAREAARKAKREAQVAGFAGIYPPKKLGDY